MHTPSLSNAFCADIFAVYNMASLILFLIHIVILIKEGQHCYESQVHDVHYM
jgi:hypothetical protein